MNIGSALGALALLASVLTASAARSQIGRAIDTFIEAELPNSAAPGLAYARVQNGEVAAKGFGERAKGSGEQVTADTPFPIGSVSKSFTALAVMQLVEAGLLGLDDEISQHLPDFAGGPAGAVTLRQLLNHTSGFSTVQGNRHHGDTAASQLDLIEYAGELAQIAPAHEPGAVWEYSNANYQILGAVIEQASGTSYTEYIENRIFEPLGMTNSQVLTGPAPAAMATGHRPWFGGVRTDHGSTGNPINAPAGGIAASARDMGRYLAMWMSGDEAIVSAEAKTMMMTPSGPASPAYGLGWSIDARQGFVTHTGLVPGVETLASFDPDEQVGVVVMVNANSGLGFADTWYLIGGIGARALGQPHADDGARWGAKTAYLSIAILPPLFIIFALVSWRRRAGLRARRASTAGKASLWLPMVAMLGLGWFVIARLPRLFGGSIATLQAYQPDFAWLLIAAATLAPAWAAFRLALAYSSGRRAGSTG